MAGADQYIPDDMNDTMGFGDSPGGDEENQIGNGSHSQFNRTAGGGSASGSGGAANGMNDSSDLNETQKLQLAERANEIYRQQLKYMQDHLASLRSLIQDKENIIENLMLRYDLGIITQDSNRQSGNLGADEIEQNELRRKAEALAQRTILENFELREMVNELRDENFHLRNEIYELQDKINRQVLQINKLEKSAQAQELLMAQQQSHDMATGPDSAMMNSFYGGGGGGAGGRDDDIYADMEEDDEQMADAERSNTELRGHKRRESMTMEHPAQTEEAQRKREERRRKHERKESEKPPDLFGDQHSDSDGYMDDEAMAKRKERANRARKESMATPDIYGTGQGDSQSDGDDDDEAGADGAGNNDKRRTSEVFMDQQALEKRRQRQQKEHRRMSSAAPPDLFRDGYDPEKAARDAAKKNTPEAIQKRLTRKAKRVGAAAVKYVKSHRRKESLAEKLLLGPSPNTLDDEMLDLRSKDPEQRRELEERARREQRRKSKQFIKSQVGDKGHLSDDDKMETDDKPQRNQLKNRKKLKAAGRASAQKGSNDNEHEFNINQITDQQPNKKRPSVGSAPAIPRNEEETSGKHRRDSSSPIVDLGFDDPEVLLHYEQLKVKDLEAELESKMNELDKVKKELKVKKESAEKQERAASTAQQQREEMTRVLDEAVDSKASLAAKCAMEIMRLTMILNTLQQHPKLKSIVQTLLEQSANNTNKNGLL